MSRQDLYTGKSGQLAVMAEFVSRGYNVAVPEVDVGDDCAAPIMCAEQVDGTDRSRPSTLRRSSGKV